MPDPDSILQLGAEAWWTFCGTLVFIMLFGFLLLETGWVREAHMTSIATKNVCMFLASSWAYSVLGFYLMYGESWHGLMGIPDTVVDKYDSPAWKFYQTGFAAVASTIISGAIAGRTTLLSNVLAAMLIGGIVFPIHGHWVWNEGGMIASRFCVHDYAGAGTVHWIGGIAALTGAVIAGRQADYRPRTFENVRDLLEAQNPHLAAAGVLVLVIGWLGFNGGSMSDPQAMISYNGEPLHLVVPTYMQFTMLAASSGGFAAFVLSAGYRYFQDNQAFLFDPFSVLSGTMGGMVAITAWCDLVESQSICLVIGLVGGVSTYLLSSLLTVRRIDDPVDAVAVHAGGGAAGMLSLGIARPEFLHGQLASIAAGLALSTVSIATTFYFLKFVARLGGPELLRPHPDRERDGMRYDATETGSFQRVNTTVIRGIAVIVLLMVVSGVLALTSNPGFAQSVTVLGALAGVLWLGFFLYDRWDEGKFPFRRDRDAGEH